MTTPHKHRDILIAVADGKKIEYKGADSQWYPTNLYGLANSTPNGEFRIAPETIVVNGVEVPKDIGIACRMPKINVVIYDGRGGEQDELIRYYASQEDAKSVYQALIKPFMEAA